MRFEPRRTLLDFVAECPNAYLPKIYENLPPPNLFPQGERTNEVNKSIPVATECICDDVTSTMHYQLRSLVLLSTFSRKRDVRINVAATVAARPSKLAGFECDQLRRVENIAGESVR